MVAVLCLHSDVTSAYRQNSHILSLTKSNKTLQTTDDIYNWLRDVIAVNVFPTTSGNSLPLTSYERKFLLDGQNYRLGPLRLVQYRWGDAMFLE